MVWRERALCRNRNTLLYTDYQDDVGRRTTQEYAQGLCEGCPVKRECAEDALLHGDTAVVRAAIALTDSQSSNQTALEYVVKHGDSPPLDMINQTRASNSKKRWQDTRCEHCDQRLRPQGSVKTMWPGTALAANKSICLSCKRMAKVKRGSKLAWR